MSIEHAKTTDPDTGVVTAVETRIEDDPRNIAVMDDDTSKVCYITDYNLFSGSSDIFRTNVGGYFFNTIDLSKNTVLSFSSFNEELAGTGDSYRELNSYIDSVRSFRLQDDVEIPDQLSSSNKIIPNHKFVVAVDGKPDKVINDKFWEVLWKGGTFNEISYDAIFNNDVVFDDYYTAYTHPYGAMSRQYLTNPEQVTNYMNITYDYNSYYQNYQAYTLTIPTERLLPNMYLNTWANLHTTGAGDYRSRLYDFISYDEQIADPHTYFDDSNNIKLYLEYSASTLDRSQETVTWANNRFSNIFFNSNFFKEIYPTTNHTARSVQMPTLGAEDETTTINGYTGSYPYYSQIRFETENISTVGAHIDAAKFSTRMLRLLKEVFTNELTATKVPVSTTQFSKNTSFLTSSTESDANVAISESTALELRGVDFFDMMLHSYARIKDWTENFIIIDEKNIETECAYDTKGVYRHLNTSNTLELMNNIIGTLNDQTGVREIESLLNVQRNSPSTGFDSTVSTPPEPKYSEVIAYRIEKRAVGRTGAGRQDAVVQNFWFFNSGDLDELNYYDSQVIYGREYTYKVYEYRIVQGLKYKYSNLQLSRVIGLPNSEITRVEEGDPGYVPEYYCIEYFDPENDAPVNDLLESSTYAGGGGFEEDSDDPMSSLASPAQRVASSRASGDSKKPYFANFVVTTEPRLKIFEIPIMEKKVTILDHPPNKLNIVPNYLSGRSNMVQFELYYETFNKRKYPKIISQIDAETRPIYMFSNELLEDGIVSKESVSRQQWVEVFRLDTKPTSLREFSENSVGRVALTMDKSNNSYTGGVFVDTIASNKKYYYVFRVINENAVPGYIEEIIEAEYINDGGYKYATFNTLYEEDLEGYPFKETSAKAKKLFQIVPSQRQLLLNTDATDFNGTSTQALMDSAVQVGTAEDLIWDKTFKIRLTSRKTGKKLDLNVTYKQNSDILGSE